MNEEQARELVERMYLGSDEHDGVDGGCHYCVNKAVNALHCVFPALPWDAIFKQVCDEEYDPPDFVKKATAPGPRRKI